MPLKPAKRGIKVWIRADLVSHFVCQFQVCTGRPNQGQEHGLGERVVKELSRDLVMHQSIETPTPQVPGKGGGK